MSETQKTCNGWTNYETWVVNLWMDNDEGSYNYWRSEAQDVYDGAEADRINTREQAATHELADRLQSQHEESLPEVEGFAADLLGAAMSEVNWHEIAEHLIDEVDKEDDEDQEDDESEPGEDDITTQDHCTFYQYGREYLRVDEGDDYKQALITQMQRDQFWPNVWFISDHGNAHLISLSNEQAETVTQ